LRFLDWTKKFHVHIDASTIAFDGPNQEMITWITKMHILVGVSIKEKEITPLLKEKALG